MNLPILMLGFVISTLYGALFHFWKGWSIFRMVLLLILSWIGFWVGHFVGGLLNISFWTVGVLNTGMATVGSAVFLAVGYWLSLIDVQRK
jgi:hypothetical protein